MQRNLRQIGAAERQWKPLWELDYRLIPAIAEWQPSSNRTPKHDFGHKTKAAAFAVPLHPAKFPSSCENITRAAQHVCSWH